MADVRITRARLRNHWHYHGWKYALWAVFAVMTVHVLFVATRPRVPEEKKIELYLCNGYADSASMQGVLWPALQASCPEQEELFAMNLDLSGRDASAPMRFAACVAAGQGDVCLLPVSEAQDMARGAPEAIFVELSPYVARGIIPAQGLDLTYGMMTRADGETGLYGIPTDALPGLASYGCDPTGGLLCLMAYGGNLDASAALVGSMIRLFSGE